MICRAQCMQEMYSALHDDRATTVCCLEDQEIGLFPHMMTYPDMDLRPSDMAQSKSQKEWKTGAKLEISL